MIETKYGAGEPFTLMEKRDLLDAGPVFFMVA
jgi:hypothetical protein